MKKRSLHLALPLAIAIELAGLGATIYGYRELKANAREADAARFGRLVDAQMEEITARLESYESVLYGAAGLLNGSQEVSEEEWQRYVQSIPLDQTAPGILGIGTIIPVPAAQRNEVIGRLSRLRGESFQYKTINGAAPPSDMSYVIDRIEPISRNRTAHGLDIGSESNRREAFEKARDSGKPQVAGMALAGNQRDQVEVWLRSGDLVKLGELHAAQWEGNDQIQFEALVVSPFVLCRPL